MANAAGQSEILYRNEGGTNFTRLSSAQAGPIVSSGGESSDCAWFDYDGDGWLDALVSNEAGQNEFLFRNQGNGSFTRVTTNAPVNDGGYSFSTAIADYDNDGRPDVFVANGVNSAETNRLYRNEGGGAFSRVAAGNLVTEPALNRSGAWGDYDNDGDLDLYVCRVGQNMLFRSEGDGTFTRITTGPPVEEHGGGANAAIWGDYDNVGWLDLFVATGGGVPHLLFHNEGDGSFRKITASTVAKDSRTSAGCSWVDYDNDGQLDLFVTGLLNETCLLYRNNGNSNAWLKVKLMGGISNRSGIGAKVRVRANIGGTNRWQLREISGGGGFGSQLQLVAHFGLGDATSVETVRVEWPSGIIQELNRPPNNPEIWLIPSNQLLTVVEPPQLAAVGTQPNGSFGFAITAAPGCYALMTSSDLTTWTSGEGGSERFVTISNRTTSFIDSTASNSPSRFYRLIYTPACGDQ